MTKFKLRFVDVQRGRNGRVEFYYFRRARIRWPLPGQPLSEEFMGEYRRLLAATEPAAPTDGPRAYGPGSFGALLTDYLASPKFLNRAASTQRVYRLVLERLAEEHGHKPIALLQHQHINAWFMARAHTPGMANMLVKVLRVFLQFAVKNRYRADNPAKDIEMWKLGEHRAWNQEECAAFEARWAAGSMQRRAYMIARYTGQRCGDIAAMTRAHRKDGAIRVVQQKTGTELWVPEHRDLTAELALSSGAHMSLLTRADGSAFDAHALGKWFADAIAHAGLPQACVMHGLRKTAAQMLAEAGCSVHEIASITGHRSLKEIERYTKGADQKRLGEAAIHRLERNGNRTASAKRPPRQSAKQKLGD
jgi:integrase